MSNWAAFILYWGQVHDRMTSKKFCETVSLKISIFVLSVSKGNFYGNFSERTKSVSFQHSLIQNPLFCHSIHNIYLSRRIVQNSSTPQSQLSNFFSSLKLENETYFFWSNLKEKWKNYKYSDRNKVSINVRLFNLIKKLCQAQLLTTIILCGK